MGRTFLVFDDEEPAKDAIPLLGRVVRDPRRPLDDFRPSKDPAQSGADTDSEAPRISFLEDQTLRIKPERRATVSAKTLRTGEATARFTKLFGFGADVRSDVTYDLSSNYIKTISVDQYGDLFKALRQRYSAEISELLNEADGPVYMMVALKTALNPTYRRVTTEGGSANTHFRIPTDAAAGVTLPALADVGVEGEIKRSQSSTLEATAKEEVAFAAEYCQIVRISKLEFSLKSLPHRTQTERRKPVSKWGGTHLAFGGLDNEEDIDDDEEETMWV